MIDLKILTIRDLLPIGTVAYAQGVSPLSIVLTGEGLDQANQVFVNDIEVPEFVVVSKNKILAQVPSSERASTLRKVAAVATVPSLNRKSLLQFEVGSTVKGIKGIEKLVQAFCKLLLQTPGTDRFRPNDGGGILKLIGRNVSKGDNRNLQASVVSAVTRTKEQLLSRQGSDRRIPADERLLNASTEAISFDPATTILAARIALSAVSGRLAVANLTL